VLVAVTFLLDAALGAFVQVPINLDKGLVLDAIGKMLLVAVGCGLGSTTWGEIGRYRIEAAGKLDARVRDRHWAGGNCFIAMYISEKAGFRRDLSKFKDVQGNLELTLFGVFYALIGAGFYEEFMFRGFLMQGTRGS
jgi:membrane protease YdiL (CAAX protease family)